jgi:hypothetical protein
VLYSLSHAPAIFALAILEMYLRFFKVLMGTEFSQRTIHTEIVTTHRVLTKHLM